MTGKVFDESKVRRGQPGNSGQFAAKSRSDAEVELADQRTVSQRRAALSREEVQLLERVLALKWPATRGALPQWNDKGHTVEEALDLLDAGIFRMNDAGDRVQFLQPVREARSNGASHEEVVDALRRLPLGRIPKSWRDYPLSGYAKIRRSAPHEEAIEAVQTLDPSKWDVYEDLRSQGEAHVDALEQAALVHVHEWISRGTRRANENKILGTYTSEQIFVCMECREERIEQVGVHRYSGD